VIVKPLAVMLLSIKGLSNFLHNLEDIPEFSDLRSSHHNAYKIPAHTLV